MSQQLAACLDNASFLQDLQLVVEPLMTAARSGSRVACNNAVSILCHFTSQIPAGLFKEKEADLSGLAQNMRSIIRFCQQKGDFSLLKEFAQKHTENSEPTFSIIHETIEYLSFLPLHLEKFLAGEEKDSMLDRYVHHLDNAIWILRVKAGIEKDWLNEVSEMVMF